ncbi:MAG: hypothetical protein JSS20_14825, partial [Proteobacteria bacterium]|nr:hypothetical protein [Pseudomonadota bacterium]
MSVGLVSVVLIAVLVVTLLLFERFRVTNSQFRERTIQNHARTIAKYIHHLKPDAAIKLSGILLEPFSAGHGVFAIVNNDRMVVDASPGLTHPLIEISHLVPKDFFVYRPPGRQLPMYGISYQTQWGAKPIWVQVAFEDTEIVFDSVLEEFIKDIGWIWVPFILVMLTVNIAVVRIGLRPLRHAANLVASLGPHSEFAELPEKGLPAEVLALVQSVNLAFSRMRNALQSQRRFIADAAHDLRTPVAVLKAHGAILPDGPSIPELREEIAGLERLVNQLLDSERLEGLSVEADQASDLRALAIEIAAQMGPMALSKGRTIELSA